MSCEKTLGCDGCPEPSKQSSEGSKKKLGPDSGSKNSTFETTPYPELTPTAIIYNLCRNSVSGNLVIEEYSGYSGFHIRTIPGSRFRNVQSIAAGNGILLALDRFNDHDMLRLTDKYGGAGEGGFDDNGFPLDLDWGEIPDIFNIDLPVGFLCQGAVISDRSAIIATLSNGTLETFIYKWQPGSEDNPNLTGLVSLGNWGEAIGAPEPLFGRPGDQMYQGLMLVRLSDTVSGVMLFDWLKERPVAFMGLPDGWTPVSIGESNNVVAVLLRQGSESKIMRFPISRLTAVMANGQVPGPSDYDISQTFSTMDTREVISDVTEYTQYAVNVNKNHGRLPNYAEPTTAQEIQDMREGGRSLGATTTTSKNDNRTQVFEEYLCTYYGKEVTLEANFIVNPSFTEILGLCSSFGGVCETLQTLDGSEVDSEKAVFRIVHGGSHTYYSDGGFVYGCSVPGSGESAGVTSGFSPLSIASDVGYERGSLKDLPDVKTVLIDAKTGLFIFQPVKPLTNDAGFPYNVYSGDYAGLEPSSDSTLKRSQCSDTADDLAEEIDGIKRPGHVSPAEDPEPTEFDADNTDLDAPWTYYTRRGIRGNKPVLQAAIKNFSIRMPGQQLLLPEYRDRVSAGKVVAKSKLFWPPVSQNVSAPVFIQTIRGGFFVPNYSQEETTQHIVWQEQIDNLLAENDTMISQINSGNLSPQIVSQYQALIASNNEAISDLQNQIANEPNVAVYRVIPSVFNLKFNGIEGSMPQQLESTATGGFDQSDAVEIPTVEPAGQPAWSVVPVDGVDEKGDLRPIKRGVVMDTNIRSWVGVDIRLDRLGSPSTNGASGYRNPKYFNNFLGINVGGNDYDSVEGLTLRDCHAPAFSYESGYDAGEGAEAFWEIDILINGKIAESIATRVSVLGQLQMAPQEAQDMLKATFQAGPGYLDLNYRKGKVFFTPEVVETVTVRARLLNYAYNVFRVGLRTVHRVDGPAYTVGSDWCPGTDPGFAVGTSCADCCGNISCTSFIFFGNKLFSSDPTYPRTRQIVWQGEATYSLEKDPYRDELNVGMGRVLDCYFDFNLNTTVPSYNIDISKNQ